MNLEQKLAAAAEPWLAQEEESPARIAALEAMVRRRSRRSRNRWVGIATAVAAALCLALFWPTVVSVASGLPVIGPYIARMAQYDQGAYWAERQGYLIPVTASDSSRGYILRVEGVVADPARTIIYYTVEGPDLAGKRSPSFKITFNGNARPGSWSGRHEVVDGKMVGELHTDPLPTPVSQVGLRATEIAGVSGSWSVSFQVSRTELDPLAKTYPVDVRWQGEGYDLRVTSLLIAPTQTVVELEGSVAADLDLRGAELTVGDQVVRAMGASSRGESTPGGGLKSHYRYRFDRVEAGEAETALFRLTGPVRWEPGGPVLELKEGARTEYGTLWYEFLAVEEAEGGTRVTARTPWQGDDYLRHKDFEGWTVVGADGAEEAVSVGVWPNGDGTATLEVKTERPVKGPVRLEARKEAKVLPERFEARIPLK